jgi:hypothetical protein
MVLNNLMKSSKFLLVLVAFFSISLICCSNNRNDLGNEITSDGNEELFIRVPQKDTLDKIAQIRHEYNQINKGLKDFIVEEKDIFGESAEGGKIKKYYENGNLRKATVSHFGEMGKSVTEFYIKEGKVFFIYDSKSYYTKPIYIEGSTVDSTKENRFYFWNNDMIRWVGEDNEIVEPESEIFLEKEKELKNSKYVEEIFN